MKGKIIVITGIDACGKETQTNYLFDYLKSQNIPVVKQSFPNYASESSGPLNMYLGCKLSETAEEIDAYQASSLFIADFLCTAKSQKFEELLEKGYVILMDRYTEGNAIHQAIKIPEPEKRKEFIEWLNDFQYSKLKIPKPDAVLCLNLPFKTCLNLMSQRKELKNGQKQDIHEKDVKHLAAAYAQCQALRKSEGWTNIICSDKNGNLESREAIHAKIVNEVQKILQPEKQQGPEMQ